MRHVLRFNTCLVLTLIPQLFGTIANAQSADLAERLNRADRNGDGQLTLSEMNQPELFHWTILDWWKEQHRGCPY